MPQIDPDDIGEKLEEIDRTWRTVESPSGRYSYEIATTNDEREGQPYTAQISTYSSSIWGNPGNAYEQALRSAIDPSPQLYVASPGNGGTSPLTKKERVYFAKTGRMTWDDDGETKPIPFVAELLATLDHEGIALGRVSGDSLGGIVITAMAAAMRENELKSLFANARPQIVDANPIGLAYGMIVTENMRRAGIARTETHDRGAVVDGKIELAKSMLTNVYDRSAPGVSLPMLGANLRGLARGPQQGNPAYFDSQAAFRNQPDASFAFVHGENDVLYRSRNGGAAFDATVGAATRSSDAEKVFAIEIPGGSHISHTYYPVLFGAVRNAMTSIR